MKSKNITWQEIDSYINILILSLYKDQYYPDLIVGVTRGGLVPAIMLSHKLNIPMVPLNVSFRTKEEDFNNLVIEDREAKNILLVDEINDSGKTFRKIIEANPNLGIRTACLFENMGSDWSCEYLAETVKDGEWINFPWE